MQQAFLVQNSGWMEPFYADSSSQFKPLIAAVAASASGPDDVVYTLAFNQSSGVNASPLLLGKGQGGGDVGRLIASLAVARKAGGTALADTDFQEAISRTITGPFNGAPGIVWIFTNNRNSPHNDAQTADRNRDFYRLLHMEPSIAKTLAFPLRMQVQGKLYAAKGLMIYALAYGQSAADALDRILSEGRIAKVLTQAPARLKPIDQDAMRIVPETIKNVPGVQLSLGADQRTVVMDVDAANIVPTMTMRGSLQNLFYPYAIESAVVEATLEGPLGRSAATVTPSTVTDLPPAGKKEVEVSFTLPVAQVPSSWSVQALGAMGKRVTLPLTVEIGLSAQRLALSDAFTAEMAELFPGDPISEVFVPPSGVKESRARVPLLLRIQYPLAPVIGLMGALLLLAGGLASMAIFSGRTRRYEIAVDGARRHVALKPFSSLAVKDMEGGQVGLLKRGLGRPRVVDTVDGRTLSVTGR
ncbi:MULTISPECIES: hypothetical protein [unclassified Variovorax]|uniref:hypothetical protein n=1 Tax=unclassified Variovorax TaxID=663243 RepID=UPI0008C765D1|nr:MULTISPECIES: hypothetical protein [unclassified Variovorax]SEK17360.1 hypothetical protein SAMN05518853_1464 [Variovorax sp. OK202]SFE81233.1 hypothetical protein SAMN05444746_1444 [Variovorax sp. OK212]